MPLAAEGMRADDSVSSAPRRADRPRDARPPAARWRGRCRRSRSSRPASGVALTTLPTGASVLVPTYELADADGVTWSVIAVVDDQLDFSAAG